MGSPPHPSAMPELDDVREILLGEVKVEEALDEEEASMQQSGLLLAFADCQLANQLAPNLRLSRLTITHKLG